MTTDKPTVDWLSEVLETVHDEVFASIPHVWGEMEDNPELDKELWDKFIAQAHKLISAQLIREKIEMLKKLDSLASRTYKQEITDGQGKVYLDDSHSYISRYETQELIADLTNKLKELEK